jgi:hypothetical protein
VLVSPCEKPVMSRFESNEDLIRFASTSVANLESCAAKIDAIREFYGIE